MIPKKDNNKVTPKKGEILPKEYFLNRITKASGVPKSTVRKVIDVLPQVIFGIMAECKRVRLCEGITLGGVMKKDDKRTIYNYMTGEFIQSKTFIRPTCEFGIYAKKQIIEQYNKKYNTDIKV